MPRRVSREEPHVFQPVRRRRRRRSGSRGRSLLLLIGSVAAVAGVFVGLRGRTHPAEAPSPHPRMADQPRVPAHAAAERLVSGPTVVHRPIALSAPAAIVIDARTGRVLWSKHVHERRQIASTTKIMTALLALRRLRAHDIVHVPAEAPRVPLVREGLRSGERVQAWKLFYGLLLYSGNDDALTLAVAAGGTKQRFIAEMNAEAKRLGLRDTHFSSTSGVIDDGNYSSAWDLSGLTRVAMRNPRFRAIVRRRRIEVPWAAPTFAKVYLNKNRLLSLYPGATGVKTGYTQRSGACIVASATRRGVSLIAVVLDSRNEYADAARLLNVSFRAMHRGG
jgi:serine-type D-Ala-D-Ala carboxypeptidase (penicillin-binding protein 5/6)